MKDFPIFTTEYGVASLTLREIPYRQEAYIRLQATDQPEALLEECRGFCRACGAEKIYGAGHVFLEQYPVHTEIIRMSCSRDSLLPGGAAVWPVLPENGETWRSIYNEKMKAVPNASFMTCRDLEQMLQEGDGYFIHSCGKLLGIGRASGGEIRTLAATEPGAGETVVRTLAGLLTDDRAVLEVASRNIRAVKLYERLGFIPVSSVSTWYQIL